jgi:probable rRNA maturation factor
MITIEVDPLYRKLVSPGIVERAAKATLTQQSAPDADLAIVLTGDDQIRTLDRNFLGKDTPTDVLSFPASETDPETGRLYLGDIVISVPMAEAQAAVGGHSLEAEVSLLVVHGVLHLIGYDHAEAEEKNLMWGAQKAILLRLDMSPMIIHEEE